ncbi:MAG TPA: hypothetical protein VJN62_15685 [Gemmatimonadales bacterium]|nr:hypothetical protein [Gemmatimonadales bacterium]
MSDDKFKVSISGPGLTFEREVDRAQADAVLRGLLGGNASTGPGGNGGGATLASLPTGDAPAEFLTNAQANTGIKQIAALAAYHKKTGGKDFDSAQLEAMFSQAGEGVPKNLSRDLRSAVSKGWIAEAPNQKGRFYVTTTGVTVVSNGFKGPKGSGRKRRKAPTSKK